MATRLYYRPIARLDRPRPKDAASIAGGWSWFNQVECLGRDQEGEVLPISQVPGEVLHRISGARENICGVDMTAPRLMGVLNVTPDSFSDGGKFDDPAAAVAQGQAMATIGADFIDIGGESTRPGADIVPLKEEITRTSPVIKALTGADLKVPISIDSRKAPVAKAALEAGAGMVNDVSALSFDPDMLALIARKRVPICLMHASGLPKTMQDDPNYGDVLLEVYDYLEARLNLCLKAGIERSRIVLDPGIGFGKTTAHNLALIRGISLLHGLGCVILLGVSRKRFIGEIGKAAQADSRAAGSIALGLEGLRQGVQMLRVHDIRDTRQAVDLWRAVHFV